MSVGLIAGGEKVASVHYHWDETHFTARFEGYAPGLPEPAHPMRFLSGALAEINAHKSTPQESPLAVFANHIPELNVNEEART